MSGSDTSQRNPRKRRRPALSCEQCRRRKVRCDREMPCGPCTKAHPALSCEYVNEGKAILDAKLDSHRIQESRPSPSTAQYIASTGHGSHDESRIAQLERTIQALQDRVKDLEHCIQRDGEQSRSVLPHDGAMASRMGNGVDDRDAHVERQTAGGKTSRLDAPQTFIAPMEPRLKSTGERVKLFGTTHWAVVFLQVHISNPFLSKTIC